MSISVIEVVSIDAACFSLWIERSKHAGFEKKSNSFFAASSTDRHVPQRQEIFFM